MPARLTKLERLEHAVDKLDEMVGSETEDEGLSIAEREARVRADRHLINGEVQMSSFILLCAHTYGQL